LVSIFFQKSRYVDPNCFGELLNNAHEIGAVVFRWRIAQEIRKAASGVAAFSCTGIFAAIARQLPRFRVIALFYSCNVQPEDVALFPICTLIDAHHPIFARPGQTSMVPHGNMDSAVPDLSAA